MHLSSYLLNIQCNWPHMLIKLCKSGLEVLVRSHPICSLVNETVNALHWGRLSFRFLYLRGPHDLYGFPWRKPLASYAIWVECQAIYHLSPSWDCSTFHSFYEQISGRTPTSTLRRVSTLGPRWRQIQERSLGIMFPLTLVSRWFVYLFVRLPNTGSLEWFQSANLE